MASKSIHSADVQRHDVLDDVAPAQSVGDWRAALFLQREPWRWNTALLISLAFHALLLSVAFGGQTFGLPGLNFPWKERRLGADDLRIFLAPAQPAAPAPVLTPAPPNISPAEMANAGLTTVEKPAVASKVTPPPEVRHSEAAAKVIPPPAPAPMPTTAPAPPPPPVMTAAKQPDVSLPIPPDAPPIVVPAKAAARNVPVQASEVPVLSDAAPKQIEQDASRERALEQTRLEQAKQNAERIRQAESVAAAQREAARQDQLRQDTARAEQAARSEAARMDAERQELARQESLRREALRQERARQDEKAQQDAARQELQRAEAVRLDAARKETARQEQARQAQLEAARQAQNQLDAARRDAATQEAARQEALKQEAARQDAIKQEAARREAAKQDAARQEALKQETARQEAAKQEAARQDAARQELARQDAAKQETARQERSKQEQAQRERAEQEAKREERLRAIGKQLNEEAAQRDATSKQPSRSLLPGISGLRRGWLLGRADANNDLVLYAEAMGRKIEMNQTFDTVRAVVKQPHTRPVVTVAIRADGSVEKVVFEVSSGVPAIDEAIRKVVASHAPYGPFPPALARQYDVVEIRRTWIFDIAIRLQ